MTNLSLLEIICAYKQFEIVREKKVLSFKEIQKQLETCSRQKLSLKQAIILSNTGIIAEFKRYSPVKGYIHKNAQIEEIVQGYQTLGASAISILTNEVFFGSFPDDFMKSRRIVSKVPILRKDFIIDEYQIYQSKMMGADAILLIASCLTSKEVYQFTETAHQLDMEVVLEIHNKRELEFIHPNIDIVGINNRNLKTFSTNIQHTIELVDELPERAIKISESGISNPKSFMLLKHKGINGFLIGEHFMKTSRPAETLQKFIEQLQL